MHAHTTQNLHTQHDVHTTGHIHTSANLKNIHLHTGTHTPLGNLTQLQLGWDSFSLFNNSLTAYCKLYISAESSDGGAAITGAVGEACFQNVLAYHI